MQRPDPAVVHDDVAHLEQYGAGVRLGSGGLS